LSRNQVLYSIELRGQFP